MQIFIHTLSTKLRPTSRFLPRSGRHTSYSVNDRHLLSDNDVFDKPLLIIKSECECEDNQEFSHDILMNVLGEFFNSIEVTLDYFRMLSSSILGYEFWNIVDLKVILDSRYEISCSSWLPAIVVALLKSGSMFEFLLVRELQD